MIRRAAKRWIDICVASVVLVLASPVLAIAVVLVWLDVGSPVIFRQVRIGRHGVPFEILKLRTMRDGLGDDAARTTRIGSFLRSTSIDELPQLINVLRGEMSLVGPRPLLPEYLELYSPRQARRHDVRPGISGLAQVSGRNELGWSDRLEVDAQYVDDPTLVLDLRILAATVRQVVGRSGITNAGAPMQRFSGEVAREHPPR